MGTGLSWMFVRVGWRNLWRNRGRTWRTALSIALGAMVVICLMSLQLGMYGDMIDLATRLGSGHLQVQHAEYLEDPRPKYLIPRANALARQLDALPEVAATTVRAEAFALVSVGEKSVGALVQGVDPERERMVSNFPQSLSEGTYLAQSDHAVVGAGVARNLGVGLGDEVVILGTGIEGSVAAMVLTVGGIMETGQAEIDRSLVQVALPALQAAFGFANGGQRIVVNFHNIGAIEPALDVIQPMLRPGFAIRDWTVLMPDVSKAIDLDRILGQFIYVILILIVIFNIGNTLVITILERTREFGLLLAVGMRPQAIMGMIIVEATALWLLGSIIGWVMSAALLAYPVVVGIPVESLGVEEMLAGMSILMPDAIYASVDAAVVLTAPLAIGVGGLLASTFTMLRIRRLRPVEALRDEE